MIRGPGGPRSDAIPAMLSNGEFVINAKATKRWGALLEQINAGMQPSARALAKAFDFPKFSTGGLAYPIGEDGPELIIRRAA
jgi:hypothetical protein